MERVAKMAPRFINQDSFLIWLKEFILNYVRMLFMGNRTTVLKSILADLSNYGDTLVISNVSSKYPGHDLSVYDNSQDIKLAAKHRFC